MKEPTIKYCLVRPTLVSINKTFQLHVYQLIKKVLALQEHKIPFPNQSMVKTWQEQNGKQLKQDLISSLLLVTTY